MNKIDDVKIAVIGLGYVGLPLAVEFSRKFSVVGFDINLNRVENLRKGLDSTNEISSAELMGASRLELTTNESSMRDANVYIVTVPTPIDKHKNPNLRPLREASKSIGAQLEWGDVVIYESTVYPGCTEEECVPILESVSGLTLNEGFFVGYSPERINPGDKSRHLRTITKITSGSTPGAAAFVDELYQSIIEAGTHSASSIKVAEAAKVIENTQRDLNIALVNELAMIFNQLGIDTTEVLAAAATKWNFLPFQPGLVGGHCIGVDPYYLTHKAQSIGFNPEVILAGRRTNDGMAKYIASRLIKEMVRANINVSGSRILVLGFTFKENCPDIRNTKVVDVVSELKDYSCLVDVHDPHADSKDTEREYGISLVKLGNAKIYDVIILAVAHDEYVCKSKEDFSRILKTDGIIYDLKNIVSTSVSDIKL
ncbi:nucleotide sugar dehydrogenase [Pseudomonadales bacterium]|nr:nucleotide sugar dehydrogenase [Pseudomonadales bacterium]